MITPMLVAHGLDSGPVPHCHISIGSHIEAVKLGHPRRSQTIP